MWKPRQLPDDFPITVKSIFDSMAEFAKPAFSDEDLSALYYIIWITEEFHIYLKTLNMNEPNESDMNFVCRSIISEIDSFIEINDSYKVLDGVVASEFDWNVTSLDCLKDKFIKMYNELLGDGVFEKRCRVLLDMFKLQIVFVGMSF